MSTDVQGSSKSGAFKVRSLVFRHRPWLSDGVWIAHEALPLFSRLAAILPSPGRWQFTESGPVPTKVEGSAPDLTQKMRDLVGRATPCVLEPVDYQWRNNPSDAAVAALEAPQLVRVIAADGHPWTFDADIVNGATATRTDGWTWKFAGPTAGSGKGAALVGFDRKNRPRFALAAMAPEGPGLP